LVQEIGRINPLPPWLEVVREDWDFQSKAGLGYGINLRLDEFVTTPEQAEQITSISRTVLRGLLQRGPFIEASQLNALGTGGEGHFWTDRLPISMFSIVGEYFIKLLEGNLSPDETDARFPNRN
jgi:hypothetical protein